MINEAAVAPIEVEAVAHNESVAILTATIDAKVEYGVVNGLVRLIIIPTLVGT